MYIHPRSQPPADPEFSHFHADRFTDQPNQSGIPCLGKECSHRKRGTELIIDIGIRVLLRLREETAFKSRKRIIRYNLLIRP